VAGALCLSMAPTNAQVPDARRVYDLEIIIFRATAPEHLDEQQWVAAREAALSAQTGQFSAGETTVQTGGGSPPTRPDSTSAAPVDTTGTSFATPGLTPVAPGLETDGLDSAVMDSAVRWSVFPWPTRAPVPESFVPLSTRTHTLDDLAARLTRSSAYEVMLHERYRQYAFPRNEARPRSVSARSDQHALEGEVTLAVERRLHLALALSLSGPDGIAYELEQTRVMRSGELHYVDHPAFGVIAFIEPSEFPDGFTKQLREELALDAALLPTAPPLERQRSGDGSNGEPGDTGARAP
jgi:hypothetical protein